MEFFFAAVDVANYGDRLASVCLRIKARDIVDASNKLKLFTDNYDFWSLVCLKSICDREFQKKSDIPCL